MAGEPLLHGNFLRQQPSWTLIENAIDLVASQATFPYRAPWLTTDKREGYLLANYNFGTIVRATHEGHVLFANPSDFGQ